ncbi:MAG: hypothetical protein OXC31_16810 [Spirochaetaceae bacterium]|nr:hypothetical protein [Spirochaetaceae bacterium]
MDPRIGANLNGPSLIRVPDWVRNRLGRYYLYFAHHQGTFIRMAYADDVRGPWTVYRPGVLDLDQTACQRHIASPDVHVLEERRRIVLYFHGVTPEGQLSFRASSADGLRFQADRTALGPSYFRVFQHDGASFAIARVPDLSGGGTLLRSPDGRDPFEPGLAVVPRMRHAAVVKEGSTLRVFYSRVADCPERILVSSMSLEGDWRRWQASEAVEVLRPELPYEGAGRPLRPSTSGAVHEPVNELRDPAIFTDAGKTCLLYSGAGETSICGSELT